MVNAKLVRESNTVEKRPPSALEKATGLGSLVERSPTPADEGPKPTGVPDSVVDQLVRWIPAETLTLYVAYIAVASTPKAPPGKSLADADFFWQWFGVGMGILFTAVATVLVAIGKVKQTNEPFRWPKFEIGAACAAFAAWALALPDTPLLTFGGYKTEIGALLITFSVVMISLVAYAAGKQAPPAPSNSPAPGLPPSPGQ